MRTLKYVSLCLLLVGCVQNVYEEKEPVFPPKEPSIEKDFNHSTTDECTLTVNYNLKGVEIPFRLYVTYPFEELEGTEVFNDTVEPYFAGFTKEDGTYTGKFSLPTNVEEVYIYTNMLGLPQCVKQSVTNSGITLDLSGSNLRSASINTRTMSTKATFTYPKGYLTLGDWTGGKDGGLPLYLLPEKANIPGESLARVNKMLNEGKGGVPAARPELFDGATVSLQLTKKAEVKMAFVAEYASFKNTIGYYHYPTGSKPADKTKITKIIAFPNFSDKTPNKDGVLSGSLEFQDQIQLKYWDGEHFQDEFPANTTIEYFVLSHGYKDDVGNVTEGFWQIYSDPALNQGITLGPAQRCVTLFKYDTGMAFVAFEDRKDNDNFRDAVFALQVSPSNAMGGGGVQIPDGDNGLVTETYSRKGTLAFEDLWPNQGDYDMNDVIVSYHSTVSLTSKGIIGLNDEFTADWAGGSIKSGFGYQLDGVPTYKVKSATVIPEMSSVAKTKGLENKQEYATIILFDNSQDAKGNTFSVDLQFVDPVNDIEPPYNPFIVPGLGGGSRSKEVHLPGHRPTDLMDQKLFGTGNDRSDTATGRYYVSADTYPFAIHLPNVFEVAFQIPKESVRIDQSYPEFSGWVESGGKDNESWYLHPKLDEVIGEVK